MNTSDATSAASGEADRPICGVVAYEIGPGELNGRWTVNSASAAGQVGTEVATGGQPGELPGTYDVKIFNAKGSLIYTGRLEISTVGDAFELAWRSQEGNYDGVGFLAGSAQLVASYWKI